MTAASPTGTRRRCTVIVGGGMLGLALARKLSGDRDVVVLEAAPSAGGLASAWSLDDVPGEPVRWDRFYHVVLSADHRVLDLYADLGLADRVHWSTVRSELLSTEGVAPMSTVLDLLNLPSLRLPDRLRVGFTVALGALLPIGRRADSITAAAWVRRWSGARATRDLWDPLLRAKLGNQALAASSVFLRATFRRLLLARLRGGVGDRFGWVEGGYGQVLELLGEQLDRDGVQVRTASPVQDISRAADGWTVTTPAGEIAADEVVVTTPGPIAADLLARAGAGVSPRISAARYVGCVCVSVVLRRAVTGGYLTYVTDNTPYTAVVEMSNHVDPAQFGGRHLVYLPKYTAPDDPLMREDPDAVAERFVADLLTRYPDVTRDDVLGARTARARFVMPVPVPGWAGDLPPFRTDRPGLWLASSVHVADGTLNVETTLDIAERAAAQILATTSAVRTTETR